MLSLVLLATIVCVAFGDRPNELVLREGIVEQPGLQAVKVTPLKDLPSSLDYRTQGLMTEDLNQHIPTYCGSCWAHAAFSSIADRMKIANGGKGRDVIPSVQALINCGNAGSCNGGDSLAAYEYVYKNGIPDVTCQQYQARNMNCSAINTCMDCSPSGGCSAVAEKDYNKITIDSFGTTQGDEDIMSEIFNRGPVAAYINANCIEQYDIGTGVFMYDDCNARATNHAIQINGWGTTDDGVDYWLMRNSWGRYYADNGFFKVVRGGRYNPGRVMWAVPSTPAEAK
jgi:cathepsin X